MKKFLLLMVAVMFLPLSLSAEIKLPALVGSNMVLQRNAEVNIWGSASPGKKVTVCTSWDGRKYRTVADADSGRWSLEIMTGDAGGPYTVTISDGDAVVLENVLLGEVWVCGGQSNMEMPVCGFMYQPVENSAEHIMYAAENPQIRLFNVPRVASDTPQEECGGEWLLPTPRNVATFSAVGYFFGKALTRSLCGVPVGLISSNWGGSRIEAWMTEKAIDSLSGIDLQTAKSGTEDNAAPQKLFNSMIWPLRNYTSKGFIWYQGESNRHNWFDYKSLMVSLVSLWRQTWGDADMPFYYVQLAPYTYEGDSFRSLAMVIEAQYRALDEIPHSGIAATTDLGNRLCIHPQKKEQVGERLACLALTNDYGVQGLPRPAPTFKSMERDSADPAKLVLSFNNLSVLYEWNEPDSFVGYLQNGYVTPRGFEIAGEDRTWHKAEGNLRWWENRIEVWSEEVPEPVAVRYAFCNFPAEANVMTTSGQPLVPFRTDDWPVDDIGEIR